MRAVVHIQQPFVARLACKRGAPENAFNFVLLKQKFNPACELVHNRVFALNHFGGIHFQAACKRDAVFGEIVLRGVKMLGRLQQGFGRNAAHVQASAAQRGGIARFVFARVDAHGFEAQLRGADGCDVAARPCADNGNVK